MGIAREMRVLQRGLHGPCPQPAPLALSNRYWDLGAMADHARDGISSKKSAGRSILRVYHPAI